MYTIQRHLNYNTWATGKAVEVLSSVDEKHFDTEVKSSFTTLRKTVFHLWDAEQIWLTRIQGGTPKSWPSVNFTGTTSGMLDGWKKTSNELAEFISSKDRIFLDQEIHYKNMKGIEFTQPIEDILFHLVNHGSFHRGQLVTMLRGLGFEKFTSQDLIAYMRL
ncbi:MAG: DinB family protein [Bacteroidetes bacterium]|nr:DinB family protein [Bacteroidota bacterium]